MDQEFIEYVVKSIVSEPDDVKIERSIDERGVLLELTVNPEDLGRVIGKRGNTAQSMRTLLRALGTKDSARYNLKIIDNGEPKPARDNSSKDDNKSDDSGDDHSSDDTSQDSADDANVSNGAGQWSHMSSDNDQTDDDATTESDEQTEDKSSTSSTSASVEQTKKELADLDDLQL